MRTPSFSKIIWVAALVILTGLATEVRGQNLTTLNLSSQSNVDMTTLRGFDPGTITGPSDPHPDTSNPFGAGALGTCVSSQYGCGVPEGSSRANLLQNCDTGGSILPSASDPLVQLNVTSCAPLTLTRVKELGQAFQSLENGLLSRLSTETPACAAIPDVASAARRCTQIEYGFTQNVAEKGQDWEMSFSLRSLTDASGNAIGAEGSYTQTLSEDGVTSSCGGTFTFDGNTADANADGRPDGLTLNGPAHQC